MKKAIFHTSFFVLLLALVSCGSPKEIPDDKMAAIIRDLLLTNSYSSLYVRNVDMDTVDIYSPILKKYGYNEKDFRYSLDRMAMRKSSRLTEIIDEAAADIKRENDRFQGRKRIRERVDSMASDRYKDTIYTAFDTVFHLTRLADKEKLVVTLPVQEGTYAASYNYRIDSSDQNTYFIMRYHLVRNNGTRDGLHSVMLKKGGREPLFFRAEAKDYHKELVIRLSDYFDNARNPSITVDSLRIVYYEPVERSRAKIVPELLNFDPEKHLPLNHVFAKKDSCTFYAVPPLRPDTACRTHL